MMTGSLASGEVAPGIHHLKFPLDDRLWCSSTLVMDDSWMLVDTGTPSFPAAVLAPYIAARDWTLANDGVIVDSRNSETAMIAVPTMGSHL